MFKSFTKYISNLKVRNLKASEWVDFKPEHIAFYATDRCNLKCFWCLRNSQISKEWQHKKTKDLDLETFKKILEIYPNVKSISFTGQGESLLNKDIFLIFEYARKKGLEIYLTSNIICLDDEKIKKLAQNKVNLNVSLKGKDAEDFERVAGVKKELFYKQVENIRKIVAEKKRKKSDIFLKISHVVSRDNFRNMREVIKLAENLGADGLLFDNLVPFNDFKTGKGCLFDDDPEVKEYIARLKKEKNILKIEFPVLLKRENFSHFCPSHYRIITVDAEGNVSGCMRALSPCREYGNIFKDKNFINNLHFINERRRHINRDLPSRCSFCVEMSDERNYKL